MKIFTRIMLIASGIMATIGAICMVIAFCMGLNVGMIGDMIAEGKLSFDIGDVHGIQIHTPVTTTQEITEPVEELELAYGAGTVYICYEEVENIIVEAAGVLNFDASVEDGKLFVEGGLGIVKNGTGALVVKLPKEYAFDKVSIEIGASSATIEGLKTKGFDITVGAGKATIEELDAKEIAVEVGLGQLELNLVGEETEYSYNVECGIGSVEIGGNKYAGLGASNQVDRTDAEREIDIECGVGDVTVKFEK